MEKYKLFSEPFELYNNMLIDINRAKKSIYLETYIYDNDAIGHKFKKLLIKKASEGVKVKLLIDAWGSTVKKSYFNELLGNGGEVKIFNKINLSPKLFFKNHKRDHRKLLLIDEKITYIGSANITIRSMYSLESVLRIAGDITKKFVALFNQNYKSVGEIGSRKIHTIFYDDFKIISDYSSYIKRTSEKEYLSIIKRAKKEVLIMTPYFVPPRKIRREFYKLIKKGVVVSIILPFTSDIKIMDILRERYFGAMYNQGIQIYFYQPFFLHSKFLVVDNNYFFMGSSNLDYRSFRHQGEINIVGKDVNIIKSLRSLFNQSLRESTPFDYDEWSNRTPVRVILEKIIGIFRQYL